MAHEDFAKILEILESEPTQQCVVRVELLEDLGIDPNELSVASSRKFVRMTEIIKSKTENMAFRDYVCLFAPKEAV